MAWNESFERIRARLNQRAFAYRAVFLIAQPAGRGEIDTVPWWAFWRWFSAPRGGELSPAAEIVLRDLERYCYGDRTTLKVSQATQQSDALAMAFAEGRRDVLLRIKAMSNLNSDQIERIAQYRSTQDE